MEEGSPFPTFKCFITNAQEEYDSGVWEFFRHYDKILSDLGRLMITDSGWRENYVQIIRYFSDLGSSIIMKRDAPGLEFLSALVAKDVESNDAEDVLMRAKESIVGTLLGIGADLELLMAEFVRLSKVPRFSESFPMTKFEGFRTLAKVMYSRGIEKSRQ